MTRISSKPHPWDKDPYELKYDEAAGLFTEDELEVVTVDFSRRDWRRKEIEQTGGEDETK